MAHVLYLDISPHRAERGGGFGRTNLNGRLAVWHVYTRGMGLEWDEIVPIAIVSAPRGVAQYEHLFPNTLSELQRFIVFVDQDSEVLDRLALRMFEHHRVAFKNEAVGYVDLDRLNRAPLLEFMSAGGAIAWFLERDGGFGAGAGPLMRRVGEFFG